MSKANSNADSSIPSQRRLAVIARPKPPIPLRPLHRIWRQTIDRIEIVGVTLPVRNLPPAWEGLIACQISDFHVDRDEDLIRLERAVEVINRQRPELVFLTGDYFSEPETMRRYIDGFQRALAELRPARGVFAVAGNHDHWSSFAMIKDALLAAGVNVLANQNHRVACNGEELAIVGIDDLWSRHAEPSRAFRGVRVGECTIVLAHNPDTAFYARSLGPGVM
ncbi:MAG: metallophosphoesterase, partial [Candidatus Binataceae bacterium]